MYFDGQAQVQVLHSAKWQVQVQIQYKLHEYTNIKVVELNPPLPIKLLALVYILDFV